MRLCRIPSDSGFNLGVAEGDATRPVEPLTDSMADVCEAVMNGGELRLGEPVDTAAELGPPLTPGKVVAVGLNYRAHVDESEVETPDRPLIFAKFPSSVIGPGAPIVVDAELAKRVDWEVELAIVIGRRMQRVPAERVLDHVLGYTVANDVSARDLQFGDGQWTRGKSLDTFCPLGPVVVTPDELGRVDDLRLTTKVNGEVMQDDSTASMIFDVPYLLEFCSRSITLNPGDVILTGTPEGCGEFMDPQRHLSPGDVVEVEIEGIGALSNPVVGPES